MRLRWNATAKITEMVGHLGWEPLATQRRNMRLCMMYKIVLTYLLTYLLTYTLDSSSHQLVNIPDISLRLADSI